MSWFSKTLGLDKAQRWIKRQTRGGIGAAVDYYSGHSPLEFLEDYGLPIAGGLTIAELLSPGALGGTLGEIGRFGASNVKGLGRRLNLGGLSGGTSSALNANLANGMSGAQAAVNAGTSSGLLGGLSKASLGSISSLIGRNLTPAALEKFLGSTTGKTLLSNLLLPQIFPNPENGQISNLMSQAQAARAAALKQLEGGAPYDSGGAYSRYASSVANRGVSNGTMGQVGSALQENARTRAMQDYNVKRAGLTADIESNYLRDLARIYDTKNDSDSRYMASLSALAELFG